MGVNKNNCRGTIFGKDFEVIVYPEPSQHLDHISIDVNPGQLKRIREILYPKPTKGII